jgi:hypothetical protein
MTFLKYIKLNLKKTDLRSNGTYTALIKTINGSFAFDINRFKLPNGTSTNWIRVSNQGLNVDLESNAYVDYATGLATRLSYTEALTLFMT